MIIRIIIIIIIIHKSLNFGKPKSHISKKKTMAIASHRDKINNKIKQ